MKGNTQYGAVMWIDGKKSSDYGLYVDTPPMPQKPKLATASYSVPGRAEGVTYHDTQYEDITLSVRCYVFDYGQNAANIFCFIENAQTVTFNTSTKYPYVYHVKSVLGVQPSYQKNGKNFLEIQFVVSPFRYARKDEEAAKAESPWYFKSDGTVYSEPIIKVYGASEGCYVTVNGTTLETEGVTGDFVIDVEKRIVYQESGNEKIVLLNRTKGAIQNMCLRPSETAFNAISWGACKSIGIIKKERWL